MDQPAAQSWLRSAGRGSGSTMQFRRKASSRAFKPVEFTGAISPLTPSAPLSTITAFLHVVGDCQQRECKDHAMRRPFPPDYPVALSNGLSLNFPKWTKAVDMATGLPPCSGKPSTERLG